MTDHPEITPALSAEEWARRSFQFPNWGTARAHSTGELEVRDTADVPLFKGTDRQKLAALCLYQQPFGFTQEDVDRLRMSGWCSEGPAFGEAPAFLESIANRIAALLPPPDQR